MESTLEKLDKDLLIYINSLNTPLFDEIMWQISHQFIWIPLFIFFAYYSYKNLRSRQLIYFFIGIGLCFLIADRTSVMLFKNYFMRYRPSHNTEINNLLHLYSFGNGHFYAGGLYGFVSSHAANFFALSTFLYFSFKVFSKWWLLLFLWASLIGYSRIYLGVHYPADVIGGALLGVLIGTVIYYLVTKILVLKN